MVEAKTKRNIGISFVVIFMVNLCLVYFANKNGYFISNGQLTDSNLLEKVYFDVFFLAINMALGILYWKKIGLGSESKDHLKNKKVLLFMVLGYFIVLIAYLYKYSFDYLAIYKSFSILVTVALVEEFVFRKVYYNKLKQVTTENTAIALSAIGWAFFHAISHFPWKENSLVGLDFSNIIGIFLVSMLLVWMYKKTGTILGGILLNGIFTLIVS